MLCDLYKADARQKFQFCIQCIQYVQFVGSIRNNTGCVSTGNIFQYKGTPSFRIVLNSVSAFSKVKVKLSLCLTKNHVMKAYWGNEGIAPCILELSFSSQYETHFQIHVNVLGKFKKQLKATC